MRRRSATIRRARSFRDTPAYISGLAPGDELLTIESARLEANGLEARLEHYRHGDTVTVLKVRRHEVRAITLTLGASSGNEWALEIRPNEGETAETPFERVAQGE